MQSRRVLLTIDSVIELFKDYCGSEDIPLDTVPLKLMVNPREGKKLAILATSESWTPGLPPLLVHFDIKRIFGGTSA